MSSPRFYPFEIHSAKEACACHGRGCVVNTGTDDVLPRSRPSTHLESWIYRIARG